MPRTTARPSRRPQGSRRLRIGVDFDDVLYPYHHFLKERIRRAWGIDLFQERVTTFYYEQHPLLAARGVTREQLWHEVQAAWTVADDHAHAALLDADAANILKTLQRRHRVVLVSARSTNALLHLEAFLARHNIRPHEILLGRSEKRGFDVLIDDYPRHAVENADGGGWSLLYTSDENSNFDESRHPRIVRVASWKEVAAAIGRIEARED